jgi:hypothetical protein
MKSRGIVYVDARVDLYDDLRLPDNWRSICGDLDLQPSKQWIFEHWPQERAYGLLCDDTFPETDHWDEMMEDAAGDWNLAECRDKWISESEGLRAGTLCVPMCWGGELLRANGWISLPETKRACGDDVFSEIICYRLTNLRRFVPEAVIEHRTPANGKRAADDTDNPIREGINIIEQDRAVFNKWRQNSGAEQACKRILEGMERRGVAYADCAA